MTIACRELRRTTPLNPLDLWPNTKETKNVANRDICGGLEPWFSSARQSTPQVRCKSVGHARTQVGRTAGHTLMNRALQGPQDGICANRTQLLRVHAHTVGCTHAKVPNLRTCWHKYAPRGGPQDQLKPQTPDKPAQPKPR